MSINDEFGVLPDKHQPLNSIWFCVRQNGKIRRSGWIDDIPLDQIRAKVSAEESEIVEICIASGFREVSTDQFSKVFIHRARGILGIEITFRGEVTRYAPTTMIAFNLSFERVIERFLQLHSISREKFDAQVTLRAYSAQQYLSIGSRATPVRLFRGSTLVEPTNQVDIPMVSRLADGIATSMINNLSSEGELPYKYWPSRGEYSAADNAIRRFLATIALARYGRLRNNDEFSSAANRNLRFNLSRYFRKLDNRRGAIVESTGAKLGAAALAGLAILECEAGEEFNEHLDMLTTSVMSLTDRKQGFRTFFFPTERDGQNWNFYLGEALLFWAELIRRKSKLAPSAKQFEDTALRCRRRHMRDRNPAFVPWYVQACVSFVSATDRQETAPSIFKSSDWLLTMQQWDNLTPDLRGRFYNPRRRDFGPPHAASTGVYLEGLADALSLALKFGDQSRIAAYRQAICRGFRSLYQLQFRSQFDTFYVSRKNRVMGCLKTEAYDNTVRIDSNAHALLAAIKVLQLPVVVE